MNRITWALLMWLAVVSPAALRGQQADNPAASRTPAAADIFSGTVTALTSDSVTVTRKLVGHDPVTRVFTLDAQTRFEGKLRPKARVTVRFTATEDGGFVAVHIIVR